MVADSVTTCNPTILEGLEFETSQSSSRAPRLPVFPMSHHFPPP